jgi:hypothetical protein
MLKYLKEAWHLWREHGAALMKLTGATMRDNDEGIAEVQEWVGH